MMAKEVPEWPLALVVDWLVVGVLTAVVDSAADSFPVPFPSHPQCAAILTSISTAVAVVQFIDSAVTAAAMDSGDRVIRRDQWPVGCHGRVAGVVLDIVPISDGVVVGVLLPRVFPHGCTWPWSSRW